MKKLLERIICSSLNNVFLRQPNLSKFIPQETAEREPNLSFHFANELRQFLFWLDCDFDVTKSLQENKRPDIVFHKRGINTLNFLVIEVKRKSNPLGSEEDVNKIRDFWLEGKLRYQFGASVVIDEDTGDYELRLLERGKQEAVQVLKKADFKSDLVLTELIPNARKMLNEKTAIIEQKEKAEADTMMLVADLNKLVHAAFSRPWSIDDIIIGSTTGYWLEKKNLLPSTWALTDAQKMEIQNSSIRLTIMYSPASVLRLHPNPLEDVAATSLIIIDANSFEHADLSREEKIAMILHEIGHVFDDMKPKVVAVAPLNSGNYFAKPDKKAEIENAADDFACKCGYGMHIASGLKKLGKIIPEKFDTDGVKARIKRMEEGTY